uniref:Uncharacterized protein n=1 Tax=Anguilla anguilla TaxID=7936 RepID=A0A0E9TK04_ANGAN
MLSWPEVRMERISPPSNTNNQSMVLL